MRLRISTTNRTGRLAGGLCTVAKSLMSRKCPPVNNEDDKKTGADRHELPANPCVGFLAA